MAWHDAGNGLEPDEITFAILLRGYGNQKPPAWSQITRLLSLMVADYGCQPDIGGSLLQHFCYLGFRLSELAPIIIRCWL